MSAIEYAEKLAGLIESNGGPPCIPGHRDGLGLVFFHELPGKLVVGSDVVRTEYLGSTTFDHRKVYRGARLAIQRAISEYTGKPFRFERDRRSDKPKVNTVQLPVSLYPEHVKVLEDLVESGEFENVSDAIRGVIEAGDPGAG